MTLISSHHHVPTKSLQSKWVLINFDFSFLCCFRLSTFTSSTLRRATGCLTGNGRTQRRRKSSRRRRASNRCHTTSEKQTSEEHYHLLNYSSEVCRDWYSMIFLGNFLQIQSGASGGCSKGYDFWESHMLTIVYFGRAAAAVSAPTACVTLINHSAKPLEHWNNLPPQTVRTSPKSILWPVFPWGQKLRSHNHNILKIYSYPTLVQIEEKVEHK